MNRTFGKFCAVAAVGLLSASAAVAQAPAAPVRPPYGSALSLADARAVVAAAEAAAKKMGVNFAIAVVEPTGEVVIAEKMDDTQYASFDLAVTKARASARFRRPTKEFEDGVPTRAALLGLPGAIPIGGGVMLLRGGKLVGAVGVSGGTSGQDLEIATAAAATFK